MLSEEALIVVAALGAIGLLVLGVLELVWPTRPRHPVRRRTPVVVRRGAAGRRRHSRHALAPGGTPYVRRPVRALAPSAAAPVGTAAPAEPAARPVAAPAPDAAAPALAVHAPAASPEPAPAAARTPRESPAEACFALYEAGRHEEVVTSGMAALAGEGGAPLDAQEAAALWSVVALARQALGDGIGARASLESAIATAPPADRATYQRQLAVLAADIARTLLAEAERTTSATSEQRIASIRAALAWLDAGQAAVPADAALADLSARAQTALWPAYEQVATALAHRQEFAAARRLVREALADPRLPGARKDAFAELLTGTFSGEIGQLTARAILSMQDAREADALAALERAEELLGSVEDDALSTKRREEVDRRLWWGYSKLGTRRLEAGDPEGALDPLLRAIRFGVGPGREQETRDALRRALEGVVEARTHAIRQRIDAGDREAAIVQSDRLRALLGRAETAGLVPDSLVAAHARLRQAVEGLGRHPEP